MKASHIVFIVEEPSIEAFLTGLLPRMLGAHVTFSIRAHQGKKDLLAKLGQRLKGYARWLPDGTRLVVVADRDDQNCLVLKQQMEALAADAGLRTRTTCGALPWQVVNRIAVEELEAWYFGEWQGVRKAFPRLSVTQPKKAAFRNSDAIAGGTWEAFERVMKKAGHMAGGLRKVEAARIIGKHFSHQAATSPSFLSFREAVLEAFS